MKSVKIICALFFVLNLTFSLAQDIIYAEYFIDQDPGLGQGTSLSISEGENIFVNFAIDQSDLTPGFHNLFVRVKDINSVWSLNFSKPFFKLGLDSPPIVNVSAMEYFIDQDPGFGNGNTVDVSAGYDVNGTFSVNISALEPGIHLLYTRVKNEAGHWSAPYANPFYIPEEPGGLSSDINYMEYFIDQDPGLGGGNALSITPGQNINRLFSINLENVNPGLHILYTRFKDASDNWSISQAHPFLKGALPQPGPADVAALVYYFFQNDSVFTPHVINGFETGPDVAISFAADINGIDIEEDYDLFIFPVDSSGHFGIPFTLNDSMATDSVISLIAGPVENLLPDELYLKTNYPNPFNPLTTIQFGLPRAGKIRIVIFDMLGKQVAEITNNEYAAGNYMVRWNGQNDNGQQVASGMYIYKLVSDLGILNRKMLLLR